MSKLTLTDLASLQNENTAISTINTNNTALETALENTLSRDGTVPNQMGAELDMDSNQIINLPDPLTSTSPLRLQDLSDFVGGGTVTNIPTGGTSGQVLAKHSNSNYDVNWTDSVTSVGLSLPADITVTNSPVTTTGVLTGAWATQTSNKVHAGPSTGSAAAPTWRTLVGADIPNPSSTTLGGVQSKAVVTNQWLDSISTSGVPTASQPAASNLSNGVTGSGAVALATSPTLVTPTLGAATATSVNKVAITAPATSATLTIANGKTATVSNSLTLAGTDSTTMTFPGTSDTVVTLAATQTLTNKSIAGSQITGTVSSGNVSAINLAAGGVNGGVANTLPVANGGTGYTGGAWTSYTPTVSAQSGTFTTTSATGSYLQIGKIVFFQLSVSITTNGTAATSVQATLPVTPASSDFAWVGRATGISGKLLIAYNQIAIGSVSMQNYDATYPGANGEVLKVSGTYQSA